MSGPRRHPPVVLKGTKPGLLDPTQAERILGSPQSTLSFATFSPDTAVGCFPQGSTNLAHTFPSKRIVIETLPGNTPRWRFVPKASGQSDFEAEGTSWPKVVELSGEPVIMYEDQWNIYKLDPAYDCIFSAAPGRPAIRPKSKSGKQHPQQPAHNLDVDEPRSRPEPCVARGYPAQGAVVETPQMGEEIGQDRNRQGMEAGDPSSQPEPGAVRGPPAQGAVVETPQMGEEIGQDRDRQDMEVDDLSSQSEPGAVRGPPTQGTAVETPQMGEEIGQDRDRQDMEVDDPPSQPEPNAVRSHPAGESDMGQDRHRRSTVQDPPLNEHVGPMTNVSANNAERSAGDESRQALNPRPPNSVRSDMRAGGLKDTLPTRVVEKRTASLREDDLDDVDDGAQLTSDGERSRAQKRPRMTPNPSQRPSPYQDTVKRYASQYWEDTKKAQEIREQKLVEELRKLALEEQMAKVSASHGLKINRSQAGAVGNMSNEMLQPTGCQEGQAERGPASVAQEEARSTASEPEGGQENEPTAATRGDEQQGNARTGERGQAYPIQGCERREAAQDEQAKAAQAEEQAKAAREKKRRVKAAREEEQRAKEAAEAVARAAAEEERRALEETRQQEIKRLRQEWSQGEWTAARAIQRYIRLFEDFKTCNFSADTKIDFDLLPWPVLWEPVYLRWQSVTWQAVEEFFKTMRGLVPTLAYTGFLTQAKLHFHPDRLTGRRVLSSLPERNHNRACEGFSIVMQAVGSLIGELRS